MARVVPARDSRVRVTQTPDGLRVDVGRRRRWWRVAIVAWIACVFGFGLIAMLTSEPPEDSGGAWFLVLWALVGIAALGAGLWGLAYREWLTVDDVALTCVRRAGPLRRARAYARDRIEDLRVSPDPMSPFDPRAGFRAYGVGGGSVAFDYGDRTIRVADVDEAEAKRVVAALVDAGL
jgi:hypothetical protein